MKTNRLGSMVVVVAILVGVSGARAAPLGTGFTYQGQLKSSGSPANGAYDLQFELFDAVVAGNQVGNPVMLLGVGVVNGLFTVELNAGGEFGPEAFNGETRWLQVTVNGQPLAPRQPLTVTPYASFSGVARRLTLPFNGDANPALEAVFKVTNTNAGGRFGGIFQIVGTGNDSRAVTGLATGFSGVTYGVFGDSNSTEGIGVYGETSGNAGVYGKTGAPTGITYGVYGESGNSSQGRGVSGLGHYGVEGIAADASGYGGVFLGAGPFGSGKAMLVGGDAEIHGQIVGNLGIGTDAPDVKLHVVGGTDSAPGGGGYIQAGSSTSTNISIDNNEIMARNNGATSTLFLNANGGNVSLVQSGSGGVAIGMATVPAGVKLNVQGGDAVFGGAIDIGYEIVSANDGSDSVQALCPAGKKLLGGGCNCGGGSVSPVVASHPLTPTTDDRWYCSCDSGSTNATAYAICAKVK